MIMNNNEIFANDEIFAKSPKACATFSKVSFTEYTKDCKKFWDKELSENMSNYDSIKLPTRSTKMSAGYDFYAPEAFEVKQGETRIIPTYIRAKMCPDTVLLIFSRSSVAIKKGVTLVNSVAVIDADFYNADNEGNIMLAFHNNSENTWRVAAGDKIAQGVFVEYGVTFDDEVNADRTGGIGSTGV